MPVMPEGQVCPARAHDPAHRAARDHAVRLVSLGRTLAQKKWPLERGHFPISNRRCNRV